MKEDSSSSGFVTPAAYNAEWQDITLAQCRTHSLIYMANRYGRRFLVKALPPEKAGMSDYRLQQEQEFQLGIRLVHPNIAATYSLEDVDGIGRCIIQEWIDGVTLGEWLQNKPSQAARERVFGQILDALEYIHGIQLVHHDLKADNILITRNGSNVKLIDFGLSATDATLSPVSNDPKADIKALGRLLAVLLPRQRLLSRRCLNGRYANLAAVRRAVKQRKRFLHLLPVFISMVLLIIAALFFYLSWQERHEEQQRHKAMVALIDSYLDQEREQLTMLVNRYDTFDYNNLADREAYGACLKDYGDYSTFYAALRDSLTDTYDKDDPQREQFWQMWVHKETELHNEIIQQLTGKLR